MLGTILNSANAGKNLIILHVKAIASMEKKLSCTNIKIANFDRSQYAASVECCQTLYVSDSPYPGTFRFRPVGL